MPLRSIVLAVVSLVAAASACAADIYDNPSNPDSPIDMGYGNDPRKDTSKPIRAPLHADERSVTSDAVAAWGFEPASPDCNGWTATAASAIRAVPPHSGTYACKLCADGSKPAMTLSRRVVGLGRGDWVVSAWLRRHESAVSEVAAHLSVNEATERAAVPPDTFLIDDWRLLSDHVAVAADMAQVTLSISANASPGQCILIDDVVVESAVTEGALPALRPTPNDSVHR